MIRVGLTGEMGSGKSYCANLFEKKGVPIFNSDNIAKKVMNTNSELRNKICKEFGNVYDEDGMMITNLMRSMLLSEGNENRISKLNELVHPYVFEEFELFCNSNSNKKYIIAESAILYESGMDSVVDKVIYVNTDEETRIRRTFERSGVSREEYLHRMKDQIPNKQDISDLTIVNNDGSDVESQVNLIHNFIEAIVE